MGLKSPRRPLHLSAMATVPLGIIMIFFASFALVPKMPKAFEPPLFTSIRLPDSGKHFIEWRYESAPAWLYRGLHALPAILWSVAMPFQHIASVRRKFPAFHRQTGYFVLTGSLVLSLSGYTLILRKIAHSHENPWHLHNLNGVSPVGWPTFAATLWMLGPVYLFTLYKTAATARSKNFKAHESWATVHTISAYVISIERVFVALSQGMGLWLAKSVDKEMLLKALNDLPDTIAAKSEVEMDLFALASVLALFVAAFWGVYVFAAAGRLRVPWLSKSVDAANEKKALR